MALIPWSAHQAAAAGKAKAEPVTRAEIAEALARAVHSARRTFRVVGTIEYPTDWDRCHTYIGHLLYQWQMADE